MAAVMEAIPEQMMADGHDLASTTEAQSAVEALRVMADRCSPVWIDSSAALTAFRVDHTDPVVIAELRHAYVAAQSRVAELYDLAVAKQLAALARAAALEAGAGVMEDLADQLEADDDDEGSNAGQGRSTPRRRPPEPG